MLLVVWRDWNAWIGCEELFVSSVRTACNIRMCCICCPPVTQYTWLFAATPVAVAARVQYNRHWPNINLIFHKASRGGGTWGRGGLNLMIADSMKWIPLPNHGLSHKLVELTHPFVCATSTQICHTTCWSNSRLAGSFRTVAYPGILFRWAGGGSTNSFEDRGQRERGLGVVDPQSGVPLYLQMSETRILIRLLRMHFPRNCEFGLSFAPLGTPLVSDYLANCCWNSYRFCWVKVYKENYFSICVTTLTSVPLCYAGII
jgi:hypothetical protein